MKRFSLILLMLLSFSIVSNAQYDNSEKISLLAGFVSTGTEYVFWSDNEYGGNFQILYDVKKIHEGAIGLKASTAFLNGYQGYYGGANLRIGSRFFCDADLLVGYSTISNKELLSNYGTRITEYNGSAFVGNIGVGYRFENNPLFIRFAFGSHFPINHQGLNTSYNIQLGFRIK